MPDINLDMTETIQYIRDMIENTKNLYIPMVDIGRKSLNKSIELAPKDTGALADSLDVQILPDGKGWAIVSDLPYLVIQDRGGTITAGEGPLKAKMLAIPLNKTAKKIGRRKSSLRNRSDLFVIRLKDGRLFLAQKRASGKPRFMFKLQKSVQIPGQNFVAGIEDPEIVDFMVERLEKWISEGK